MYKNSRKGAMGFREIMITLVFGGILALVGILVFSKVDSSISRDSFSAAQNTTYTGIVTTVLDSYSLAVVGLIVLAAVGIMATLFAFGG